MSDDGKRGWIKWRIGPARDENGNCITTAYGHKCRLDPKHDGFCVFVLDPSREVIIKSDRTGD